MCKSRENDIFKQCMHSHYTSIFGPALESKAITEGHEIENLRRGLPGLQN